MLKTINLSMRSITYELTIKNVKNINLRIKSDGTIHVSANQFVQQRKIDDFIKSKEAFILNTLTRFENNPPTQPTEYFSLVQLQEFILKICNRIYPYYQKRGVDYPVIKFRAMKSCWGNCRPQKGILTFSTNLRFAPSDCIEYVVLHEFTHFLQSNHSKEFYCELEKVCMGWKDRRKQLRDIKIN